VEPNEIPDPKAIEAHFIAALPKIEDVARFRFRHLRPEAKEEKVAETVALAWREYRKLCERGKNPDEFVTTLADFSARAVRNGRRLAGKTRSGDVMAEKAQKKHGFEVGPLPDLPEECEATDALKDNTQTPPPDQAAFRIDYTNWLSRFPEKKRRVIEHLALGGKRSDAAKELGLSAGRITQIGNEAEQSWGGVSEGRTR
jgi:hypothetical protein